MTRVFGTLPPGFEEHVLAALASCPECRATAPSIHQREKDIGIRITATGGRIDGNGHDP